MKDAPPAAAESPCGGRRGPMARGRSQTGGSTLALQDEEQDDQADEDDDHQPLPPREREETAFLSQRNHVSHVPRVLLKGSARPKRHPLPQPTVTRRTSEPQGGKLRAPSARRRA